MSGSMTLAQKLAAQKAAAIAAVSAPAPPPSGAAAAASTSSAATATASSSGTASSGAAAWVASLPAVATRTVSADFTVTEGKHPLRRRWSLMHGKPASSEPREWRKAYTTIRTVSTVEDLVLALAAMEQPSELVGKVDGHTLLMFQEGATPDWKDPLVRNKGGRWDLTLRFTTEPNSSIVGAEEATQVPVVTDEVWSKTLLSVAGEALAHPEDVVGVAIEKKSDRSADLRAGEAWLFRLSLWMQTAADLNLQTEIGCSLRDVLDLPEESVAFCSFRREDRDSNPKITI